ncbi:MAG: selenocysteine-specific translation elongation factor [Gemmatimonadetes bacterium]|nr:selenocysteine-specific translation elongation factor [Gemmatimonadota bacterium]
MILGTAGHIDHGKTALVRALTGVDTDRLPEEKRRGITIALGFAPLVIEGLGTLGVVDVPGHEAFVRTMLAGATGIDLALLVIAADEGVMPQTREHLAILSLLGVRAGVVALTKSDLVDPDLLALAAEEVRGVLATSSLADAAIVPVSAHTGAGLDDLRAAIRLAAVGVPARHADEPWRMPVDRVFSVAGAGTVVTGTAWTGTIARDDIVRILPLDRTARVRSLESHGETVEQVGAGTRVAVALAGVSRDEVSVEAVLVRAGDPWSTSHVLRADVSLLEQAPAVQARRWLRFHLGTADVGARVIASGGPVVPGQVRAVRLILDAPVVARAGDRFVLRAGGSDGTIGGGVVTDPLPPSARAKPWAQPGATDLQRVGWMLDEAGAAGLDTGSLPLRLGLRTGLVERLVKELTKVVRVGDRLVRLEVLGAMREVLMATIERMHVEQPLAPGLDRQVARQALTPHAALADEVIRRAERAGLIVVDGAHLRRVGFAAGSSVGATSARDRLLERIRGAGVEALSIPELVAELGTDVHAQLKLLEKEKLVVMIALDRPFSREAVQELLRRLRSYAKAGTVYAPSELREALGITRKWLIPFLEWCDRQRISLRRADGRTFGTIPENP